MTSTQFPPHPPRPYEPERDPVVWLIGIVAVLAAVRILNHTISVFEASGAGRLVGSAVGAFAIVFLIGLIGAKIAGKSPGRSRIGFTAGALLVLAGIVVGEYRMRDQEMVPLDDLASRRNRLSVSASDAAEMQLILEEARRFAADATAAGEAYQRDFQRVVGDGLAHASKLDTAAEVAETRARLLRAREIVDARDRDVAALADAFPARVNALPINEQLKLDVVRGFHETSRQSQALSLASSQVARESISEVLTLADFMESRLGQFRLDGNSPIFKTPEDVAAYNRIIGRLRELAVKEEGLLKEQKKMSRESLDALEQLGKSPP